MVNPSISDISLMSDARKGNKAAVEVANTYKVIWFKQGDR